jgi:hypothetical protein
MLETYDIIKKSSNLNSNSKDVIHKFKTSPNNLLTKSSNSTFHSSKSNHNSTNFQKLYSNIEESKLNLHIKKIILFFKF